MQQLAGANKKRKRTGSVDAFPIVTGIIMLVIVVITLYPVLNTLAISIKRWHGCIAWRNLSVAEKIYMEKLYHGIAER